MDRRRRSAADHQKYWRARVELQAERRPARLRAETLRSRIKTRRCQCVVAVKAEDISQKKSRIAASTILKLPCRPTLPGLRAGCFQSRSGSPASSAPRPMQPAWQFLHIVKWRAPVKDRQHSRLQSATPVLQDKVKKARIRGCCYPELPARELMKNLCSCLTWGKRRPAVPQ